MDGCKLVKQEQEEEDFDRWLAESASIKEEEDDEDATIGGPWTKRPGRDNWPHVKKEEGEINKNLRGETLMPHSWALPFKR